MFAFLKKLFCNLQKKSTSKAQTEIDMDTYSSNINYSYSRRMAYDIYGCHKGVRMFFQTATPILLLYSRGLIPPSVDLIRSLQYQCIQVSTSCINSGRVYSSQLRPQNISVLRCPKNPSHAELSGEHPFFDIDLIRPADSIMSIHPDQR